MYLPRIIARFGLFSNVGRFMIMEKPQKLFFPTFVSDYNNPERYRNKDMKVNLNKGAIEGLFLEQGQHREMSTEFLGHLKHYDLGPGVKVRLKKETSTLTRYAGWGLQAVTHIPKGFVLGYFVLKKEANERMLNRKTKLNLSILHMAALAMMR